MKPEDILPSEPERVKRVRTIRSLVIGERATIDLVEVEAVSHEERAARVAATVEVAKISPDALRIVREFNAAIDDASRRRLRAEHAHLLELRMRQAWKRASAQQIAIVRDEDGREVCRVTQPAEWGEERLHEMIAKMEFG